MVKRLGGGLLGFGVNTAGEFCISYNVRMGEVRACARSSHIDKSVTISCRELSFCCSLVGGLLLWCC
jgi:hypothetical protein